MRVDRRPLPFFGLVEPTTPKRVRLLSGASSGSGSSPGHSLGNLAVSLSNGSLSVLRPTEDATLSVSETWHAHDYEPWITAWNYWDTNVLYSGTQSTP